MEREHWFGLHERLESPALARLLDRLGLSELARWSTDIPSEHLAHRLATHLGAAIAQRLLALRDADRSDIDRSLRALAAALSASGHPLSDLVDEVPAAHPRQLLEVVSSAQAAVRAPDTVRPDVPLALSALLTGSRHSPSLVSQIEKELASADRADWLVAFIKFSGIRSLRDALRRFTELPAADGAGPRLRIATTSYLGATDPSAVEFLLGLPNTEVRVCFDTQRTRLHAKAYLFHRRTGFGTGYVGSANVSRVALDEGLEWTARISQQELPHVWRQLSAGFEMHWQDEAEFEPIRLEELTRFSDAIHAERGQRAAVHSMRDYFDLRPYGFQQQILEALTAERAAGRHRHLVVAATGTGKTLLAAFDYRARCSDLGSARPRLLFVAHRKEILAQALQSFREVLRDRQFGELLADGARPLRADHLFCTVQSWNSQRLDQLDPAHFDYVVVDEAHHGTAASYQRILTHLKPQVLIGLTATPERTDGSDIRPDFGGSYSHELRLPDAVEARLLSPFHYFGIEDASNVDLSRVRWLRGVYHTDDLDRIIGHNEVRARWVLRQLQEHVADLGMMRALGFCVSQAHAEYMAAWFNRHGVPSMALTASSPRQQRDDAQRELVARRIRVIFSVDLYNEGVDIPEVDTLLMLRPTESLTVYLQQLGRGLRLHSDKAQLTVLDFVARQRPEFRYAERFRALSSRKDVRIDVQIDQGFPWLPAGCLVRLTRQAKAHVLENIRTQIDLQTPRLSSLLRALMAELGSRPSLQAMLDRLLWEEPDSLLSKGLPSALLGLRTVAAGDAADAKGLQRGLRHLAESDDPEVLDTLDALLQSDSPEALVDAETAALALSLIWGKRRPSLRAVLDALRANPHWSADVRDVVEWRRSRLALGPGRRFSHLSGPLRLHARYTREQILIALGFWTFETASFFNAGVLQVPSRHVDAFFVTLDKDERLYSPDTMYEDYALSASEFHWQTQGATGVDTPVGQRYLRHREMGYTPLLFVRRANRQANGLTEPFRYLGPLDYVRHEGNKPISIVWRLLHPMPAAVYALAHRPMI